MVPHAISSSLAPNLAISDMRLAWLSAFPSEVLTQRRPMRRGTSPWLSHAVMASKRAAVNRTVGSRVKGQSCGQYCSHAAGINTSNARQLNRPTALRPLDSLSIPCILVRGMDGTATSTLSLRPLRPNLSLQSLPPS
jgi:hypothetical protein